MKTYTVHAKRWRDGWELHIAGLGVTQCRTLDTAARQAQDYIETVTGASARVEIVPELGSLMARVRDVRAATERAAKAVESAAADSRAVARDLRGQGLSVSDAAYVMGISRGRLSQLVR